MGRKTITTPEQDLIILDMHDECHMTFEAISIRMGLTISTARRAYQRALVSLTKAKETKGGAMEQVIKLNYGRTKKSTGDFKSALTEETPKRNFILKFFSGLFK